MIALSPTYLASLADLVNHQKTPPATLYVVATPIGNLADITLRALAILQLVDAVAAEDTRNSGQFLTRYGLHKSLIAVHQHNENMAAEKICHLLASGQRIALISDAGTPGISDPGQRVVAAVRNAGFGIVPLPGAAAWTTLASVAGLSEWPSDMAWHFVGFLPNKAQQRQTYLQTLDTLSAHLVLYEAPHRIMETITALAAYWPDRQIVIGRELSKQFEEIVRLALPEAVNWLSADENRQRGEFVLIVSAPTPTSNDLALPLEAVRTLEILLDALPTKQAVQLTAAISGLKKNSLYAKALELKK